MKLFIYLVLIVYSFGNIFSQDRQKSADDIARELFIPVGTLQLLYWFSGGNGWQIGGSPNQSANYVQGQDIEFSIPINLGFAKTVVLGKMPLKFSVQDSIF